MRLSRLEKIIEILAWYGIEPIFTFMQVSWMILVAVIWDGRKILSDAWWNQRYIAIEFNVILNYPQDFSDAEFISSGLCKLFALRCWIMLTNKMLLIWIKIVTQHDRNIDMSFIEGSAMIWKNSNWHILSFSTIILSLSHFLRCKMPEMYLTPQSISMSSNQITSQAIFNDSISILCNRPR
jgi:hypothetical protein